MTNPEMEGITISHHPHHPVHRHYFQRKPIIIRNVAPTTRTVPPTTKQVHQVQQDTPAGTCKSQPAGICNNGKNNLNSQHDFSGGGSLAWERHHSDITPLVQRVRRPAQQLPASGPLQQIFSRGKTALQLSEAPQLQPRSSGPVGRPRTSIFSNNQYGRSVSQSGRGGGSVDPRRASFLV